MDAPGSLEHHAQVEAFGRQHLTGLVTLLFTDMVDSTALKQRLGRQSFEVFEQHHQLIRAGLARFPNAQEVETAGDSFFLIFAVPSDAVEFALGVQAKLRTLFAATGIAAQDRIGINLGEVVIREPDAQRQKRGLFGLQVDTCARVMSLAKGGQILMTRQVFDSARQVLKGEAISGLGPLSWVSHGYYQLKGVEEPVEVCEVGEMGHGLLIAPTTSEKARRFEAVEAEPVLGWRPAVGQVVPNTQWVIEQHLGYGGFGEVWLGRHQKLKEQRVFKFCFRADRVRSLKREVTLFRLLKERIGGHPNIVGVQDVFFEEPPYYVMMDYAAGKDLAAWCAGQGGIEKVPLEVRLEIVAQVAEALQAAHDAGIIHRDVKPANILVSGSSSEVGGQKSEVRGQRSEVRRQEGLGVASIGRQACADSNSSDHADAPPAEAGTPTQSTADTGPQLPVQVKLTDFGIGQVLSEEYLAGVTRAGFTQTMMADSSSSQTGTQLYLAPELLAGKPASIRSDIYSLGVVLYQLLVGDFTRPVTAEWAEEITDPLLKEDLKHCLVGKAEDRFTGAAQLANNLRGWQQRKMEVARRQAEQVERERLRQAELAARERAEQRAAQRHRVAILAGGAAVLLLLLAITLGYGLKRAEKQRRRAEAGEYAANMNQAQQAWDLNNVGRVRQLLEDTAAYPERGFEWYYWQRQTHLELKTLRGHSGGISSVAFSPDGQRIVTGSVDQTAKVWEAASGKELLTLRGHSGWISSVAFSPDGQRIVTGSVDQTAKVWETASGKELLPLKGHSAWIYAVTFSPDGQRIVTGSGDGTAKVWEAANGTLVRNLVGHSRWIRSVAFSPDGQRILTGSGDFAAKLWEAVSGKELLTLKGHSAGLRSVAFSPDGQRIVTGSVDQTAKVWETATAQQVAVWEREEKLATERLDVLRREQAAAAKRERALRAQDSGAIKQWLVLAPIPFEGGNGKAALLQEQIPQEAFRRPRAGERVKVGERELAWNAVQLEDNLIDFNQLFGEATQWSVAYAVCYIHSEAEQTGLLMKVGSDDQAKIYLNEKEIYQNVSNRPCVLDEDVVAGVELHKGLNVLVFKVVNESGNWQGSVRFTDATGQAVKGIKVTLTP